MSKSYHCLKSAVSDCRNKGMSDAAIQSVEMVYRRMEEEMDKACSSTSTGWSLCLSLLNKVKDNIHNEVVSTL